MLVTKRNTYDKHEVAAWPIPNHWDGIALILVLALLFLLGMGAKAMVGHYEIGQSLPISLDPKNLPYYSLRTVLRMFIALGCSLFFTFIFGTWAAKSRAAEKVIVPAIDILQSVPVLGFLTITVPFFLALFKGRILGPECAAIFAIFTAQVWNIALSFYQSLRTVPKHLHEAAAVFQLSQWQVFWRVDVPYAMPGLLWNAMMSMSGSWVFLVAAEAITVAHQNIRLPGIGSYIWLAIQQKDKAAIGYVILAMFLVIALYDQLFFRPLVAWVEKFKAEETSSEIYPESWVLVLFQQTKFLHRFGEALSDLGNRFVNFRLLRSRQQGITDFEMKPWMQWVSAIFWNGTIILLVVSALVFLTRYILSSVSVAEIMHVAYLGLITGIRVTILIIISSIIWVPIGVLVGSSPRASQIVQPIAQFLAAFPANLLFPVVVMFIVKYNLNANIWVSPLMILGTQWYILFNVIAGTMVLPKNMRQAVRTLNVRGWLWWRKFILPGIFPYYITGAITAAGGAWNISIIAEAVSWGNTHLPVTGLGAYITQVANQGDFPRLTLGIVIMSLYVLIANRLLWRPLYILAEEKYQVV